MPHSATLRWKLSRLAWLGAGLALLVIIWQKVWLMENATVGTLLLMSGTLLGLGAAWAGLRGFFQAAPDPAAPMQPAEAPVPVSPEQARHDQLNQYVFCDLFPEKRVHDERIITAAEVAQATHLDEAVVREWLANEAVVRSFSVTLLDAGQQRYRVIQWEPGAFGGWGGWE